VLLKFAVFKSAKSILFLTIFIDLLGFGIVIPILPNYVKSMTTSNFLVGLMVTAFAFTQFFTTPVWGALSDKYGRRPIILASLMVSTVAYVVLSFATSLVILFMGRVLSGIGSGNISAAQAYISDITEPKDRAKSMGLIGAAFGLGFIFGPPIGGFLMHDFGFASIGWFCAGLCLINLALAYFMLPESLKQRRDAKINVLPVREYRYALSLKLIPPIFLSYFIFTAGFFLFQLPSPMMWKEFYGYNDKNIGWIFMFIGISTAIVQGGLIGIFNKWFGERNLMLWGNILLGVSVMGIPFVPKEYFIPLELILLFGIAVGNGFVGPSSLSIVSQLAPRNEQGTVMGIYQSVGSLARVFGPILGSSLYGVDYRAPYLVALVVYGLNAVLVIVFLRKLKLHEQTKAEEPESAYAPE